MSALKKKNKEELQVIRRLLRVDDSLAGIEFSIDAYNDLKLTHDIELEMDNILQAYQFTAVLEAHAEERYDNKKVELEEYWGELEEHCRSYELVERATDQKVKAWIARNPDYVKRKKKLLELKRRWGVLKFLVKSFYMKYELIRTKSANTRKEYGDLSAAPTVVKRFPRPKTRKKKKD